MRNVDHAGIQKVVWNQAEDWDLHGRDIRTTDGICCNRRRSSWSTWRGSLYIGRITAGLDDFLHPQTYSNQKIVSVSALSTETITSLIRLDCLSAA